MASSGKLTHRGDPAREQIFRRFIEWLGPKDALRKPSAPRIERLNFRRRRRLESSVAFRS